MKIKTTSTPSKREEQEFYPGSYLFRGPSDQTVGSSVSFTLETNGLSLAEWTILVQWSIQITHNTYDPRMIRFQC